MDVLGSEDNDVKFWGRFPLISVDLEIIYCICGLLFFLCGLGNEALVHFCVTGNELCDKIANSESVSVILKDETMFRGG